MGNIQEGVLNTLEALFAKRLIPEEVTADGLKSILEPFFSDVRSFAQVDLENISTFSNIIQSTQDALVAWGKSCTRQGQAVTVLEFQLNHIPPISVQEVEAVLTRFIEFAIREKENGNSFLDDDLLDDSGH